MLYYRKPNAPETPGSWHPATIKIMLILAMGCYPMGGIVMLNAKGDKWIQLTGFGLMIVSLLCAAVLVSSSLQRVVSEETKLLDERELVWRQKSNTFAYHTFTVLVLLMVIYFGMATDSNWWLPSNFDHWNSIFWGIVLYATLLPTAYLAWTMKPLNAVLENE